MKFNGLFGIKIKRVKLFHLYASDESLVNNHPAWHLRILPRKIVYVHYSNNGKGDMKIFNYFLSSYYTKSKPS